MQSPSQILVVPQFTGPAIQLSAGHNQDFTKSLSQAPELQSCKPVDKKTQIRSYVISLYQNLLSTVMGHTYSQMFFEVHKATETSKSQIKQDINKAGFPYNFYE